jgi:hypothetical protein
MRIRLIRVTAGFLVCWVLVWQSVYCLLRYPLLRTWRAWQGYFLCLAAVALAGALLGRLFRSRMPKREITGLEAGLASLVGVAFGAFLLLANLQWVNGRFDRSRPQVHRVSLTGRSTWINLGPRYYNYRIYFPDWEDQATSCGLTVDQEFFESRLASHRLRIITGQGFLGWEWVREFD